VSVNVITSNTSLIQRESSGCMRVEISFNLQFIIQTGIDDKNLAMALDTAAFFGTKRPLIKYICCDLSWGKNDKGCLRVIVLN